MLAFVLALIAGLATPFAEPHIKTALEKLMLDDLKVEPSEFRTLAYAVMMLGAALVAALGDSGSGIGIALGGLVGLFGKRIFDAVMNRGSRT
jgi:hypothetical protein